MVIISGCRYRRGVSLWGVGTVPVAPLALQAHLPHYPRDAPLVGGLVLLTVVTLCAIAISRFRRK